MIEKLKLNECMKAISITYLILFCILKLVTLTQPFETMPLNVTMFITGCAIFMLIFIKNKGKLNYSKLLIIFILAVIINCAFHFDMSTIKTALFEIFYVLIIYNIAKEYLTQENYLKLIKILMVITFILVYIFFINYLIICVKNGIPTKTMIAHIVFANINGGALLASMNIIMASYLYKIKKMSLPVTIFLCLYYLIFIAISQARTTFLALLVLGCYALYQQFIQKKLSERIKKVLKISSVSILAIVIILFSIPLLKYKYDFNNKFDNTIYGIEQKMASVTTLRYWLWKYSIEELIETNPIFGLKADFGEDCFNNIQDDKLLEFLSTSQKGILKANNLHNGYVQVLVRNGIFGFGVLIAFFIIFSQKLLKTDMKQKYNQYIIYLYLYYIVINLFENHIIFSNSLFVLFLWIHIGMDSRLLKSEKIEKVGEK